MRCVRRRQLSGGLPGPLTQGIRAKLGLVLEEADESVFWVELILELGLLRCDRVNQVLIEAGEIVAIMAAAKLTAERGRETRSR